MARFEYEPIKDLDIDSLWGEPAPAEQKQEPEKVTEQLYGPKARVAPINNKDHSHEGIPASLIHDVPTRPPRHPLPPIDLNEAQFDYNDDTALRPEGVKPPEVYPKEPWFISVKQLDTSPEAEENNEEIAKLEGYLRSHYKNVVETSSYKDPKNLLRAYGPKLSYSRYEMVPGPVAYKVEPKPKARGGYGAVFKGEDLLHTDESGNPREVAVKVTSPVDHLVNAEDLAYAEAEAETMLQVMEELKGIKGIVQVYDYTIIPKESPYYGGSPVIVMEYKNPDTDPTLKSYIKTEKHLKNSEIVHIVHDLARITDAAAKLHLYHGDLKLENLFINKETKDINVSDWGSSNWVHQFSNDKNKTLTGTTEYAPPEVLNNIRDLRSEEYSVAVIAFKLLTDELPHTPAGSKPTEQALAERENKSGEILEELGERFSPEQIDKLKFVFRKALSRVPEIRYQNVTAFANALENALKRENSDDSQESITEIF
jgi:hypothetical protein